MTADLPGAPGRENTITLLEETAKLAKRDVVKARVRVSSRTVETVETLHETLHDEDVTIERIRCERIVDTAPSIRHEGNVTVIPVVKEVMIVKLMLVEEIIITKNIRVRNESKDVLLKSQEFSIERLPPFQET